MHVMVVRPDNAGDVLLAGPAVRAVAASADEVSLWCGPRGRPAAELLPGVDRVVEHQADWIDPEAADVDRGRVMGFVDDLTALRIDQALVLTSFHQSPLPAALLLRMAGIRTIAAVCEDFPGALLDIRHRVDDDVHEAERSLSLAATLGYRLPANDHGGLAVELPDQLDVPSIGEHAIAVHPGASAPARAWTPARYREAVDALAAAGWLVVVTGGPHERQLTGFVAGDPRPGVRDLGGLTDLTQLAAVLTACDAVITGNTGPAHLSAAVGTPVVSLFAPTVPARRWRPWGVRHVLLGDQDIACAGCRATQCPLPGHPCIGDVTASDVVAALQRLLSDKDQTLPALTTGHPAGGDPTARASASEPAGGDLRARATA
jgi:ADP-heptose:LPS heptosyltransferase